MREVLREGYDDMDLFLGVGGGFLVAVIWMDLMFDVLALAPRDGAGLPEESLSNIATYYRRVTTDAAPMNTFISAVMAGVVGVLVRRLLLAQADFATDALSLALCGVPIVLALLRVFPNAIRLGARKDTLAVQSAIARSIAIDHLLCLSAMLSFLLVRFLALR